MSISTAGRPEPSVRWWRGERLLESRELPAGTRIRKRLLLVPRLSRADLHAALTCQAVNSNLTLPAEARVALDINFRPLLTSIELEEQPLSSGRRYHITCRTVGSRPPAAVSWWLDNTRLITSTDQVSSDSNETLSTLSLTPSQGDNGRLLTCRAENSHVRAGIQEHSVKLSVYYAPTSELRLGQRMRPDDIKEGSDVYFECRVRANPPAYKVTWKFQGQTLVQNASAGVIVTDEALALQSVGRQDAGDYSCVASNVEGDGESPPLVLRVKYKPVCQGGQRQVFAVSPYESAHVRCSVDAAPPPRGFRWAFNNSAETLQVPQSRFNWSAAASELVYTPVADGDYGSLLCWAHNAIGQQQQPCVFHVMPAGRPDMPSNCSLLNQTSQSVAVQCVEGFDGGQPQSFLLEVVDGASGHLLFNMTQPSPTFLVDGLAAGQLLQLRVSAFSAKGRSEAFVVDAATLLPAEVRAGSEPEAASSPRGTPVAPDPEPPPPPQPQAAGGLRTQPPPQVFSVCSSTPGAYVPHPTTLRRPSKACLRQADEQPEVTYAELRLPPAEAEPAARPWRRHEPVIYAQIDHVSASTSALSALSPRSPPPASLQRTASPPHSLPLLEHMHPEVVTVRTPLMSGQQESCV
ncbi:roundabout homolog 3-like [Schistocerca cancellata]|uniref:roundabout homolog 3-like n=1 Tax=Schistocerca cancellata TaxID=274614 RepID=UPI002117EB9C|nr:roundabout homolog 3-like [Schistocerca cancellata]